MIAETAGFVAYGPAKPVVMAKMAAVILMAASGLGLCWAGVEILLHLSCVLSGALQPEWDYVLRALLGR